MIAEHFIMDCLTPRMKMLQSLTVSHITYSVTQNHIPKILTLLCIIMAAITQGAVGWLYEKEMDQEVVSLLGSNCLCAFICE